MAKHYTYACLLFVLFLLFDVYLLLTNNLIPLFKWYLAFLSL